MRTSRREFLRDAIGLGGLMLIGGLELRAELAPGQKAGRYLASRQSPDGAWRSNTYAAFRDGDALTPVALWALLAETRSAQATSVTRGLRWMQDVTDRARAEDAPWSRLRYPLFTASCSAQVFARIGDLDRAAVWARVIKQLQTSPALGWPAESVMSGAWSDAGAPPRYVSPVPDMLAPNISATALALAGLESAGCADAGFAARRFIEACQNYAQSPSQYSDGGFFFAPDDPIRNKAGIAGQDADGRVRFRSYGSATCDGYLALRACGAERSHPRLRATLDWIEKNESWETEGGAWAEGRTTARESLAFYHAQALAATLRDASAGLPWVRSVRRKLANRLTAQQNEDGSWQGSAPQSCEDDSILATAFALRALTLAS